jgi:hypothetical protein
VKLTKSKGPHGARHSFQSDEIIARYFRCLVCIGPLSRLTPDFIGEEISVKQDPL